jgi:hypothetical protein
MAQGNAWVLIPDNDKNNLVPQKLAEKWNFTEQVDGQDEPQFFHPTWVEASTRLRTLYGDIRNLTHNGTDYIMCEYELSYINGEIASVVALQTGTPGDPAYFILTNSEAIQMLSEAN